MSTLLYKLVAQVLLFGCQTLVLTESYLSRIDGVYAKFVSIMLQWKRQEEETLDEFIIDETLRQEESMRNTMRCPPRWRCEGSGDI
eukprot:11849509-Karenia_brevis.AAC.1